MSDKPQQTRLPELQFTQAPNLYFELMPVMSEPEMKVMGAAIRNIIGYHKTAPEPMAQSWFIKKTGLSRNAVKKGIIEAVDRGWLAVATDPTKFTSTEYVLVFEGGEVSRNDPRKEDRGSNCDPHEMTPQKKEVLKKDLASKEAITPPRYDTPQSEPTMTFDEYKALIKRVFEVQESRVMDLYNILQGRSKKHVEHNIQPPVTSDELKGFAMAWALEHANSKEKIMMPRSPELLHQRFTEWRQSMNGFYEAIRAEAALNGSDPDTACKLADEKALASFERLLA